MWQKKRSYYQPLLAARFVTAARCSMFGQDDWSWAILVHPTQPREHLLQKSSKRPILWFRFGSVPRCHSLHLVISKSLSCCTRIWQLLFYKFFVAVPYHIAVIVLCNSMELFELLLILSNTLGDWRLVMILDNLQYWYLLGVAKTAVQSALIMGIYSSLWREPY